MGSISPKLINPAARPGRSRRPARPSGAIRGWLLAALLAGLALASPAAASDQMQRMLIGSGCYRVASHGIAAVPAYCLDQAGTAPRRGAILGETPALGEATVALAGGSMSLKAALARHLLRIEGADAHGQLSLVNMTDQPLSLCVRVPVVVMGNGMSYSADLRQIFGKIVTAVQHDAPAGDGADAHARLQDRLWDLVNQEEARELAAPLPVPGAPPDDRRDCPPPADAAVSTITLCR